MKTQQQSYRNGFILLAALSLITFAAFLGLTLFNTKGEPREAVVALSMLKSDNWILPVSNGADIPYKPPMLAWCIALLAKIFNGGEVNEYLSRLPSALAALAMTLALYKYCARYRSAGEALVTSLVMITSFEVHRAATNCRVDMLLTAFMVIAILIMFDRLERNKLLIKSLSAILLLSGAVLTKGPVGVVLPLLVVWIYGLLTGHRWLSLTLECIFIAMAALVLPAAWYAAAVSQGGEEFIRLAIEENFGRMTGSMSYESHENGWWYNILTILAGMLPYTLLAIAALFLTKRGISHLRNFRGMSLRERLHRCDRWKLLMSVLSITIFIFYCIPKSKRSVYLLPLYPALAWGTVVMARRVARLLPKAMKAWCALMAIIALAATAAYVALHNVNPQMSSRSLALIVEGIHTYHARPVGIACCWISAISASLLLLRLRRMKATAAFHAAVALLVAVYWSYSSLYQPAILNVKSDKPIAEAINEAGYTKVYGVCSAPMLRFYTADFYTGDKIQAISHSVASFPSEPFVMLIGRKDLEEIALEAERKGRKIDILHEFSDKKSCDVRQEALLVSVK